MDFFEAGENGVKKARSANGKRTPDHFIGSAITTRSSEAADLT